MSVMTSLPSILHQSTLKPKCPCLHFHSILHLSISTISHFKSTGHCGQPVSSCLCVIRHCLYVGWTLKLTLTELKRIGRRPRNICRVLDNHVDISDGCSTNINTPIRQYWECQINAHRWKDEMHLYLFPSLSSIKAASHWFSQTNCLDDYQLSPKRFMIVTVTSVESNALHLADFK